MAIVLQSTGGGSVSIQEPTTASNFTQTLPASTGTVMVSGNMPAFSASPSGTQSISNVTFTKVTLGTKSFDTNNNFASSTFTPTVAGYYQLNGIAQIDSTGNFSSLSAIYKNGSAIVSAIAWGGSDYPRACVSVVVYANGTTDYFDLYTRQDSGVSKNLTTATFSGCLVRTA
jgi:hypothetical protein